MTAITAGSNTSRTIGVKSFTVTVASVVVNGFVTQTPVKNPMVCGLALFFREVRHGDRAAAARLVDDLHALRDQLFFLQHFGDRARQKIRAAAGTGVNNRFDLFARFEFLAPGALAG